VNRLDSWRKKLIKMKSLVTRDKNRRKFFQKYESERLALKILQRTDPTNINLQLAVSSGLNALPRNSSKTRIRNRCVNTGRGRGVWRAFRLSRIQLRTLALKGELIGVRISSW
jgi:ribosomal protein S14